MIPTRFYLSFPDCKGGVADFIDPIDTETVVRLRRGEDFRFGDFDADLSAEVIKGLAETINESRAARSYDGPISNKGPVSGYKDEVISFLDSAVWRVESTQITCKRVVVFLMLIPGNPNYRD